MANQMTVKDCESCRYPLPSLPSFVSFIPPSCCRYIGTASMAAIGGFIIWGTSGKTSYYSTRPTIKLAVRSLCIGAFYLSAARFFYLPPFSYLKGHNDSVTVTVNVEKK